MTNNTYADLLDAAAAARAIERRQQAAEVAQERRLRARRVSDRINMALWADPQEFAAFVAAQ